MSASMQFRWAALSTIGTPPPRLQGFSATADTAASRIYVFGGRTPSGLSADLRVLDVSSGHSAFWAPPRAPASLVGRRTKKSARGAGNPGSTGGNPRDDNHNGDEDDADGVDDDDDDLLAFRRQNGSSVAAGGGYASRFVVCAPFAREGHAAALTHESDLLVLGGEGAPEKRDRGARGGSGRTAGGKRCDDHGVYYRINLGPHGQPGEGNAGRKTGPLWERHAPVGTLPAPRVGHCAIAVRSIGPTPGSDGAGGGGGDEGSGRGSGFLVVFGGREVASGPSDRLPNDIFVLDLDNDEWRRIAAPGGAAGSPKWPAGRHRASFVESRAGRLVLSGGFAADGTALPDCWMLDCSKWTWREIRPGTPLAPSPRGAHSTVCLRSRTRLPGASTSRFMVAFGGAATSAAARSGHACNDALLLLHFGQREWTRPRCVGEQPRPRSGHTAVALDGAMYMLGGDLAAGDDPMRVFLFEEVAGKVRVADTGADAEIRRLAAAEIEAMRERCAIERGDTKRTAPTPGPDSSLNREFQSAKYLARIAALEQDVAHKGDLAQERGAELARVSREMDRLAAHLADTREELKVAKKTAAMLRTGGSGAGKRSVMGGGGGGGGGSGSAGAGSNSAGADGEDLDVQREDLHRREQRLRAERARVGLDQKRAAEATEAYATAVRGRVAAETRLRASEKSLSRAVADASGARAEAEVLKTRCADALDNAVRAEKARAAAENVAAKALARAEAAEVALASMQEEIRASEARRRVSDVPGPDDDAAHDKGRGGGKGTGKGGGGKGGGKGGGAKKGKKASADADDEILAAMKADLDNEKSQRASAEADAERRRREVDALCGRLEAALVRASAAEADLTAARDRATALESAIAPLQQRCDSVAAELAESRARQAALEEGALHAGDVQAAAADIDAYLERDLDVARALAPKRPASAFASTGSNAGSMGGTTKLPRNARGAISTARQVPSRGLGSRAQGLSDAGAASVKVPRRPATARPHRGSGVGSAGSHSHPDSGARPSSGGFGGFSARGRPSTARPSTASNSHRVAAAR